jgi:hypothetical protein
MPYLSIALKIYALLQLPGTPPTHLRTTTGDLPPPKVVTPQSCSPC